jgi:hypothetical protein
MLKQLTQFTSLDGINRIDAEKGIIYGVSVITLGEAKGHGMSVDYKTLDQILQVARTHKNGLKVKFGLDHEAGVADTNGTLKNFRLDGTCVRADLHLFKSDTRNAKLLEMAADIPDEFGISLSFSGEHETLGYEKKVRCSEIYSADIVSDPAANKSLFSANNSNTNMKELATLLGLPETATELEIKEKVTYFKAEACKYEAEAKKKKELEAEAKKAEMEAGNKDEKFAAIEKQLTELAAKFASNEKQSAEAVKLAEIKTLVADASKEGKVVPLSETELSALSIDSVKSMLSKLPKGQVNLSSHKPANEVVKLDKNSTEFKTKLSAIREANAVELNNLFKH